MKYYTTHHLVSQAAIYEKIAKEISDKNYLWHGSRDKIEILKPRQAKDIGGHAGSNQKAIYATSLKKFAIMMGLTTKDSDIGLFWDQKPIQMVLYDGKIRNGQKLYLHKLPRKNESGEDMFTPGGADYEFYSKPWVSEIKPTEIMELNVDDYLHLIRKANKKDWKKRNNFFEKNK